MYISWIYPRYMAKVIVSISDELLTDVDNYCVVYRYNRSELVRYALRGILNDKPKQVQTKPKKKKKE